MTDLGINNSFLSTASKFEATLDVPSLSISENIQGLTKRHNEVFFQPGVFPPPTSVGTSSGRIRSRHTLSARLVEVIRSSRSILSLEDNWDDEGSPSFTETTWSRATKLIKDLANSHWRACGVWVNPPRILPALQGSIDVHWKTEKRELLMNVPAEVGASFGYYGSGSSKDTIKGKLDPSLPNDWILMWLLR